MGYNSKIIVAHRRVLEFPNGGRDVYADDVAVVEMGCMGAEFHAIFNKEIDYKLFIDSHDIDTDIDRYGEHLKYAPINKVIEWVEQEIKKSDYRRLKPLLGLLKGFDQSKWAELQVVHYGH